MTEELTDREKLILAEFPALLKEAPVTHASKQLSAIFHSWSMRPVTYEVYEAAMLAQTRNWASDFLKSHLAEYLRILMKQNGSSIEEIAAELERIKSAQEEIDFTKGESL